MLWELTKRTDIELSQADFENIQWKMQNVEDYTLDLLEDFYSHSKICKRSIWNKILEKKNSPSSGIIG